jgi:hypothetical protein
LVGPLDDGWTLDLAIAPRSPSCHRRQYFSFFCCFLLPPGNCTTRRNGRHQILSVHKARHHSCWRIRTVSPTVGRMGVSTPWRYNDPAIVVGRSGHYAPYTRAPPPFLTQQMAAMFVGEVVVVAMRRSTISPSLSCSSHTNATTGKPMRRRRSGSILPACCPAWFCSAHEYKAMKTLNRHSIATGSLALSLSSSPKVD